MDVKKSSACPGSALAAGSACTSRFAAIPSEARRPGRILDRLTRTHPGPLQTGALARATLWDTAHVSEGDAIWGLISDVHGNYPALELALRLLGDNGANSFAFLGDYLRRGESDRCI